MTVKWSWCTAARGAVAMIAADELQSLMETTHLLRSPKNAERLLVALARTPSCFWLDRQFLPQLRSIASEAKLCA